MCNDESLMNHGYFSGPLCVPKGRFIFPYRNTVHKCAGFWQGIMKWMLWLPVQIG